MSKEDLPRKEANVLRGHEGAVLAARFNRNGEYCLSCGKDRTIRLWNPHRGLHIKTYKSHGREVRDVHVTPDNSKLCSCGGDRQVFYWDVATGRVIRKFRGHDSEVCLFVFSSCLNYLDWIAFEIKGFEVIGVYYTNNLLYFDTRSEYCFELLVRIDEDLNCRSFFTQTVTSVSYHPKENCMITASVDGTIRVWAS
ncbi:WD repeat domain-containing 83 [Olea europaea subsp. europaea]|uniref:WD repeat domain-containing 83 n=1 Tax=Olea europaea subsp. europaea TaxID=158383 RepID=A0A8S0TVW6_OLEEU|nr:WD repeat domain-containing 83 [Olea europaea subsp. europaea]